MKETPDKEIKSNQVASCSWNTHALSRANQRVVFQALFFSFPFLFFSFNCLSRQTLIYIQPPLLTWDGFTKFWLVVVVIMAPTFPSSVVRLFVSVLAIVITIVNR